MKAELEPITSKPRPGDQPNADGKKPFWCHCGDCGHEFAPFWVPKQENLCRKEQGGRVSARQTFSLSGQGAPAGTLRAQ